MGFYERWILPRLIGLGPATDLLLTGRTFSGAEARDMGLVHEAPDMLSGSNR